MRDLLQLILGNRAAVRNSEFGPPGEIRDSTGMDLIEWNTS
jgi:hypothetical protein